ncbi:MAG: potassium channel family protein [Proteobacteria bacterium]|nr:potassium channel family protein [Pseudomonadota bacterium]
MPRIGRDRHFLDRGLVLNRVRGLFRSVTLTTVGYGDSTPIDPLIRGLSTIETIVGQLYPAPPLARLMSSEMRVGWSSPER